MDKTNNKITKTITESDILQFANISGDFNPIHINKEYAEKSVFGDRIAHGMLVASYISTILGTQYPGEGTIYLEQNTKFLKPVRVGDTITIEVNFEKIINKEKRILQLSNIVCNQNNELVLNGHSIVKVTNEFMEGLYL